MGSRTLNSAVPFRSEKALPHSEQYSSLMSRAFPV